MVAVSHTLCAHVGGHKHFGYTEARRFGAGMVPKFWGYWSSAPWDGAWLTPRNMLLFHLCYRAKFCHSRTNHTMEIFQKKIDSCVPPFKVTQDNWNWYGSIAHQWLFINVS